VAAKSGQFTADESGKGQFLQGHRRILAGEGVVRKISSPLKIKIVERTTPIKIVEQLGEKEKHHKMQNAAELYAIPNELRQLSISLISGTVYLFIADSKSI